MQEGAQQVMESRPMTERDLTALRSAVAALEHPTLAARLGNMIGKPIELIGAALPASAAQAISAATSKALEIALQVALRTMQGTRGLRYHNGFISYWPRRPVPRAAPWVWRAFPSSFPSRPSSCCDRSQRLRAAKARICPIRKQHCRACRSLHWAGEPARTTFLKADILPSRAMLAKSVSQAARFVIERGAMEESAPILVRFIAQVASRFGLVVTQKVAAQTIPLLGGLGGAAVNYAFIEHFQGVARAHFTVRRLERIYGSEIVRQEYERFAQSH